MAAFDYDGALKAGYTDDEIKDHLAKSNPSFDVDSALKSGYSLQEVNQHLSGEQPKKEERSFLQKAARVGGQFALGVLEGSPAGMVYDISVAPIASKSYSQSQLYQDNLDEIGRLAEQKAFGEWDQQHQDLLDSLTEQVKNPKSAEKFAQAGPDISIRGLAEKATGVDLHPEGFVEKALNWVGFIKQGGGKKLKEIGLNAKELTKAVMPGFTDISRGVAAGGALELAEQGQFGPVGTIAAAITGDILGHAPKATAKAIANPKQTLAEVTNFLTLNNTKRLAATQIADDFAKSGLQIDSGTLLGSPLVQMMQARLSQSGLTGTALDNFRKSLSGQVVKEYESILGDLGELTFSNNHQAAEAVKNALKVEEQALNINKESLSDQASRSSSLQGRVTVEEPAPYQEKFLNRISETPVESTRQKGHELKAAADEVKQPFKEEFNTRFTDINEQIREIPTQPQARLANELNTFVEEHAGSLLLGESAAEHRVFQSAQKLLNQLRTEEGALIGVTVDELIKTRRTLADIADWEFHGSNFQSAYKKLVGDVNEAIDQALARYSPELRTKYLELNSDYEQFKRTFENPNLKNLYEPKNENYNTIYKEISGNPDKIRSLEDAIGGTEEGAALVNRVKRDYAQQIIERPLLTAQDLADLQSVLGPQYAQPILEFVTARQRALEHPLPTPVRQNPLGLDVPMSNATPSKSIKDRQISETGTERARAGVRKKVYEELSSKTPDQIMQQMNTIEGIRKLKQVLNTTPEGRQLFKELARYKIAELIDKNMMNAVTEQVKLGTFANFLKPSKNKELVKELLGTEAYSKLELLQKNAGALNESAAKFFNASKSGTTVADVGLVATAVTGIMTGNPFMAVPAISAIGGSWVAAKLLSDPVFLRELEKAIRTNNPKKFQNSMQNLAPIVGRVIEKETVNNKEQQ